MLGFPTGSGLPSITQITFSACCAHYPGGSAWCLSVAALARSRAGFFPARVGLPGTNGRSASTSFLSRPAQAITHVTACRVAHPPYVGFVTRLQPGRLTPPSRSSATKAYRQLLGWVLPPLVICAIEAHVRFNNFRIWGDSSGTSGVMAAGRWRQLAESDECWDLRRTGGLEAGLSRILVMSVTA